MNIKSFVFSPFMENTYVLSDETKECIIVDPGCYTVSEEQTLYQYIADEGLTPVMIANTHCHIDHVFGVTSVRAKYDIPFYYHELEQEGLDRVPDYAPTFGLSVAPMEKATGYLSEKDTIKFGNTELTIRFVPGHSVGSLAFVHDASKTVIAGDALFKGSIGRVDLPGGDYATLMASIMRELMTLPEDYTVYSGHMDTTTIGEERRSNPFVLDYLSRK